MFIQILQVLVSIQVIGNLLHMRATTSNCRQCVQDLLMHTYSLIVDSGHVICLTDNNSIVVSSENFKQLLWDECML